MNPFTVLRNFSPFHFTFYFILFYLNSPINPTLHFTLLFLTTTHFPSPHFPSLFTFYRLHFPSLVFTFGYTLSVKCVTDLEVNNFAQWLNMFLICLHPNFSRLALNLCSFALLNPKLQRSVFYGNCSLAKCYKFSQSNITYILSSSSIKWLHCRST
jgi:hypothetical protein